MIYKICRVYTRSSDDLNDLYQEAVIQLWKAMPGFAGNAKVSTYIYRVVLNTALIHKRKERRRQAREEEGAQQLVEHAFETTRDEQDLPTIEMLYAAIHKLRKEDRMIIILYLEQKSYDEIAEITGLTKVNVGVRINRIKERLYNLLEKNKETYEG
jgi:RNA polymerase sigma-70 factor (ECF subfamily)